MASQLNFKVYSLDNLTNPINASITAFQDLIPSDVLILKIPIPELDYDTAKVIYNTVASYFPNNKLITLSSCCDILSIEGKEAYKAFLKEELAKLEEN